MNNQLAPRAKDNICKYCQHSKDRFRESCYCIMYGIIVTYGKQKCRGFQQIGKEEKECQEH